MSRTASPQPDLGRHSRRSMTRSELIAAWISDRLPWAVRSRVTLGGRELGLMALLAALGLVVVAVMALRSSAAAATPAAPPVPIGSPRAPSSPLVPAPGSEEPKTVVVDVAGKVAHPGVRTLPAGSRVFEALKAAGGVKKGVDTTSVNLARVLVDGEQIVIGAPAVTSTGATGGASGGLLSLNQADEAALEELPGIGPVMAHTIIAWRTEHGGFTQIDELQEISGIGPKTFAKLKPLVQL